jgi:hypothetical protein
MLGIGLGINGKTTLKAVHQVDGRVSTDRPQNHAVRTLRASGTCLHRRCDTCGRPARQRTKSNECTDEVTGTVPEDHRERS